MLVTDQNLLCQKLDRNIDTSLSIFSIATLYFPSPDFRQLAPQLERSATSHVRRDLTSLVIAICERMNWLFMRDEMCATAGKVENCVCRT
jgi:hypothetical protein